ARTVAAGYGDGTVRLWEISTGDLRAEIHGHRGRVSGVAYLPDGLLVTASEDHTALTWDVHRVTELSLAESPDLWDDLAGDARTAFRAVSTLVQAGDDGVGWIAEHARPAEVIEPGKLDRLI